MSICKYCQAEIEWKKDGQKNIPTNPDGTRHNCQQGKPSDTSTSPKESSAQAPLNTGLKTIEGQITTLDIPAHKVWLKDREGNTHYFIWGPALHDKMSGLKQWWFVRLTGEYEKDVDLWRLTAQDYFKRPDDWPFKKPVGKGTWQPRNENLIVFQCTYKECCETMRVLAVKFRESFDDGEFQRMMDIARDRAIADAKALIAAEKEMVQ